MKIEKAINISLEDEEFKTLDEASRIIEELMDVLEETGNKDIATYYGMWDTFNHIADICSDFKDKYPIEIKTI